MTRSLEPDPLSSRHNSFTFLRFAFATLVVIGHSYVLGGFGPEPLEGWTGKHIAGREIAVQGFFILSGFLIAKSLAEHPSLWRFFCHRCFRIFPALWCCLGLIGFVLAPWIIERAEPGRWDYWERVRLGPLSAWDYVRANWLAQAGQYHISKVFAGAPGSTSVNGSLWSIQFEVIFYIFAAGAAIGRRMPPRWTALLALLSLGCAYWSLSTPAGVLSVILMWCAISRFRVGEEVLFGLCLLFACLSHWNAAWVGMIPADASILLPGLLTPMTSPFWHATALPFVGGMLCWKHRHRFRWSSGIFLASVGVLAAGVILRVWPLVMPIALPYCVFYLAAKLPCQRFDRIGDYSYGIYIYSFPIQQLLVAAGLHHAGLAAFALTSVVMSIAVGGVSWYCVEKPMLRVGRRIARIWEGCPPVVATVPGTV